MNRVEFGARDRWIDAGGRPAARGAGDPATRRRPPPIAVPSEASPPHALTETEPVITAPSSPVAGYAGAGRGALDGGRTWLGLVNK